MSRFVILYLDIDLPTYVAVPTGFYTRLVVRECDQRACDGERGAKSDRAFEVVWEHLQGAGGGNEMSIYRRTLYPIVPL